MGDGGSFLPTVKHGSKAITPHHSIESTEDNQDER